MKQPKAVLYTRVSTNAQAEQGTGLEVQEAACLRKAQELGAEVVDIISDEGVSGAFYLSRPGIQKALTMLEAKQADTLITMKLDRSGRDADVLSVIRKRVQNAGAKLVFVDGANFENNATGNLLFRVNAGFVEYEKEVIRERTTGGRRKRAESGVQPCRTLSPYGFHVVTKEDVLIGSYASGTVGQYMIVEEKAVWVRAIYERYQAGASLRQIKKWLASEGVPSPEGCADWNLSTLRRILSNPAFMGKAAFGRTQRKVDEERLTKGFVRTDYAVPRDKSEWVHLDCTPIVSEATWQACQTRIETNKERRGNPRQKYLLTRLMYCPHCKRRMGGLLMGKTRYYRCPHDRGCPYWNINANKLEEAFLRQFVVLIRHPELMEAAIRAYDRTHSQAQDTDDRERLQDELNKLDRQEDATARAQIEASMEGRSTEVYDRLLSEINSKRHAVQIRLQAAQTQVRQKLQPRTAAEKVCAVLEAAEAVLLAEDVPEGKKNELLQQVTQGIYPNSETKQFDAYLSPIVGHSPNGTQILIRVTVSLTSSSVEVAIVDTISPLANAA
jgi:site-specific DNA recombinase